jgi:protein TonB
MILDKYGYPFMERVRRYERVPPVVVRDAQRELGASPEVIFEASLACSILIVVLTFLFFPEVRKPPRIIVPSQEVVRFEDVEHTRQENRPPPPPRPPIPIEAPGDEVLEDAQIGSTEIDIRQEVAPPQLRSQEEEEQYFVAVEEMPQLIGGMEAVMKNLVYPELAIRAGVQGRVFVLAYINENGDVVRAEVQKGIGAGCDEAAVAAVLKAKFIPGRQRGKPIKVKMVIPIRFQLSGN